MRLVIVPLDSGGASFSSVGSPREGQDMCNAWKLFIHSVVDAYPTSWQFSAKFAISSKKSELMLVRRATATV